MAAPIDSVAEALGFSLTAEARGGLAAWLARMQEWNARIDLTAARSEDELADLMVADALVMAARVPEGAKVVDVGTGAGAPGLALALVRPDLKVTLVEPLAKRVSFLRTVLGEVGREDVVLVRDRGEAVAARGPGAFDEAVARATLPPPAWLALGAKLVRPGGGVWVLLAKEPAPELTGFAIASDVAYAWPRTGAQRRAVRYQGAAS